MRVDLDDLEKYTQCMESTGSSPCYVPTLDLKQLVKELKAARLMREGLDYAYHGCTDRITCEVCRVLKKYDETVK